ncbi:hypothetical protein [Nocardia abscessus]|uniref:hypothetical protein n=1 Tax=Nocardia abscessus TaxID=120957 RepID=UPI002455355F|nr:hypothetical protein [Nocardia abscessus]
MSDIKSRIPEPALIRGAVVAVLSLVGVVLGHQIELPWLDEALNAYAVVVPLALSLWIRQHVSPAKSGDTAE